ncbi:MAG: DUF3667 domain-containing protein [Colwellia sp.]|uniref:DUF3667 domain-containing protein n=1 Tax=Colwellia sp. TaxID=56799 RepID=UPI001D6AC441|nr:DUF3667 domain-containing protein [Colwellia sp.]NQY47523.1 DUF3667 domain-containing protein [Colwellia sp.]
MPTNELIETEPAAETAVVSTVEIKECENCHQPLNGPYCANCGQEADSKLKYFWVVIMHLLDDILSFDSRASRTVWPLVTRPAFITNEYFAGRRVHYVPPIRLYLFISIIFFLTLNFFIGGDNNKVININDKQALITQVKGHIKSLKVDKIELEKIPKVDVEGVIESNDEEARLKADIATFNGYLSDLNSDYGVGNNKKIIKITRKLVELEFDKVKGDLPEDEQARFDALITSRVKAKKGEVDSEEEPDLTIGNNGDGTITFDFLSDEHNKKLSTFSKELTGKFEKAFNSDTGPLIEQIIGKLPQLMFILLPLFAFLLKIMFIFSKRLYMEHLTVALHSHSFIFIAILLSEMLELLDDYLEPTSPSIANFFGVVAGGLLLWIPIYLFLMQKKVYKQGYFFTLVKFTIIGTIYSMMILVTGLIAFVWGLMGT